MTVTLPEVLPLMLAACPSAGAALEPDEPDEPRLPYIDAGAVARHVVDLVLAGTTEELPALFAAIEQLHVEGVPEVRELATIGYLEDLQNAGARAGLAPDRLERWLGPESLRWWRGLTSFWEGGSPRVLPQD